MKTMSQVHHYEDCFQTLDEARAEIKRLRADRHHWKTSHDNQVALKQALMNRPDLADRARGVMEMEERLESLQSLYEGVRAEGLIYLGLYNALFELGLTKSELGNEEIWSKEILDRVKQLLGQALPKVNIVCEHRGDGIIGTTDLNVVRVEREDDGSITAVTDHWPDRPETKEFAARYAYLRHEKLTELLEMFPTPDTCDVGLDYAIDVARGAAK